MGHAQLEKFSCSITIGACLRRTASCARDLVLRMSISHIDETVLAGSPIHPGPPVQAHRSEGSRRQWSGQTMSSSQRRCWLLMAMILRVACFLQGDHRPHHFPDEAGQRGDGSNLVLLLKCQLVHDFRDSTWILTSHNKSLQAKKGNVNALVSTLYMSSNGTEGRRVGPSGIESLLNLITSCYVLPSSLPLNTLLGRKTLSTGTCKKTETGDVVSVALKIYPELRVLFLNRVLADIWKKKQCHCRAEDAKTARNEEGVLTRLDRFSLRILIIQYDWWFAQSGWIL
jgi:hypothetical protein